MRELAPIALWRLRTRRRSPIHPSYVGFWPLAAKLRTSRPPKVSNGVFTAVLLVHRRPANIDLQIRAALHTPSVGEVVVSCNNPQVRPRAWIGVESPRLRILEEQGRNQTRRYAVALASGGERFVLPDDDVLFLPESLDRFCAALPADGSHPVGLTGQRLLPSGLWESAIDRTGEEVDVLNRAYACTREHAAAVFDNASRLGWSEEETFSHPADDVLVSFGGKHTPTLVNVDYVNCVSHSDVRISTYRQGGFHEARAQWVTRLRELHDRPAARRDLGGRGALDPGTGAANVGDFRANRLRRRFYSGDAMQTVAFLPSAIRNRLGVDDDKAMRSRRVQIGSAPAPLEGFIRLLGDAEATGFADEVVAIATSVPLGDARRLLRAGGRLVLGIASEQWTDDLRKALAASAFDVAAVVEDGSSLESHSKVSPWDIGVSGESEFLDPLPSILDGSADVIVVARAR